MVQHSCFRAGSRTARRGTRRWLCSILQITSNAQHCTKQCSMADADNTRIFHLKPVQANCMMAHMAASGGTCPEHFQAMIYE